MEIERKFLIKNIPDNLNSFNKREIEQAYLCSNPVVRIRRDNDDYYLTYKSKGHIAREEYNLPLTKDAYEHLLGKADGIIISKNRYELPEKDGLTIELDEFLGEYKGLWLAEVEFESLEQAESYIPPDWFSDDVSMDKRYKNNQMAMGFADNIIGAVKKQP